METHKGQIEAVKRSLGWWQQEGFLQDCLISSLPSVVGEQSPFSPSHFLGQDTDTSVAKGPG